MSELTDRLAALDAAAAAAEEAERRRAEEARERAGHLTRLRHERAAYEVAVGAGERERDPSFEDAADAELRGPGVEEVEVTRHGEVPSSALVDRYAEARRAGAAEATEAAKLARREFVADNLDALASEVAAGARADHAAVVDALVELDAALEPVRERDRKLLALHRLADAPPPEVAPFRDLRHAVSDQWVALEGRRKVPGFAPESPDTCACGKPLDDAALVGLGDPVCGDCAADPEPEPDPAPTEPAGFRAEGEGFEEAAG